MRRVLLPPDLPAAPPRPRWPGAATTVLTGPTMGVSWTVKAQLPPQADPEAVGADIQGLLDGLVLQMSQWEPDSDLSRFNRAEPGTWISAPAEMFEVVEAGLAWAERTGGAFDPALGRLVDAWGFGPERQGEFPPAPERLEAAWAASGWRRLAIDRTNRRLRQPGGLGLDLSGIAKGYAVDAVSRRLHALDAPDHLVEIGGELTGSGVKPDGQPWWGAIETPPGIDLPDPPLAAALHGLAVATSGVYRQSRTAGAETVSHIVDGRLGAPAASDVVAATVFARRCMDAEALATALLVMGAEAGARFAASKKVAARLVVESRDGFAEILSPELTRMLG